MLVELLPGCLERAALYAFQPAADEQSALLLQHLAGAAAVLRKGRSVHASPA